MEKCQVHKFGGSTLADSQSFNRVCELILQHTAVGDLVVASAAGTTTDQLVGLLDEPHAEQAEALLLQLYRYQSELLAQLLVASSAQVLEQALLSDIAFIRLHREEHSASVRAHCLGYGEVWSTRLLAALLNQHGGQAQWLDARVILQAGEGPQPEICLTASRDKFAPIQQRFAKSRLIVTGFIARTERGDNITLGRHGSDYSASMLALLAQAERVTMWTDVTGVFSADPRKVSGAHSIPLLSLQEANELARLGSPVLHARTLQPLLETSIRVAVRSPFAADGHQTEMISGQAGDKAGKTVTYLEQVSVISLEVPRDSSLERLSEQLQRFLKRHQLMPLAQHASSELKCIRLCFTEELASIAFTLLKDYQHGGHLTLDDQYALLALVGAGVRDNSRHYYSFYRCLDDAPLEFVETGPDGVSLVAILRHGPLDERVAQLHQVIASPDKRVGIVLMGLGNVGRAWLQLFYQEQANLCSHHNLSVCLAAVVDQQRMRLDFAGLSEQVARQPIEQAPHYETQTLLKLLATHPYDELVVIDAHANEPMSSLYPQLFAIGSHIVSANKEPAAAPLSTYHAIKQHQKERACHWLYGATIAACLPITESMAALQHAGDQVESIEGVLSGSWSRLLAEYDGSVSFTQLVKEAWREGITEPDPRDDLSGADSIRKLLILSRKLGMNLTPEQINCQSLLPQSWQQLSLQACWQSAAELDAQMAQHYAKAQAKGERLCYHVVLTRAGEATIELTSLPPEHAFGCLPAAVTSAAIRSRWYADSPLLIQGPGAGPQLGAGAMQMDLFRLCRLIRQV